MHSNKYEDPLFPAVNKAAETRGQLSGIMDDAEGNCCKHIKMKRGLVFLAEFHLGGR